MSERIELPEGFAFTARSRGRTISEADFSAMTNLTWTTAEIHTNRVVAEREHGGLLLAGACVLAFALGLATPAVREDVESRGIRFIALVGYDDVRFVSPLRPGDTIYVEATLESITRTSKPERGVLHFRDALLDHEGRVLARYVRSALCDLRRSVLYQGATTAP
jgi:acyl dehydratase